MIPSLSLPNEFNSETDRRLAVHQHLVMRVVGALHNRRAELHGDVLVCQ